MNINKIKKSMTNIKPDETQIKRIENVREAYKDVVNILSENCKDSRELDECIKYMETSLMWATKSIVLEGE